MVVYHDVLRFFVKSLYVKFTGKTRSKSCFTIWSLSLLLTTWQQFLKNTKSELEDDTQNNAAYRFKDNIPDILD